VSLIRMLSVLVLGWIVALAQAQQPPPVKPPSTKSALEEALEQALKHNPDLQVATAKLTLVEAEVTRARLAVVQQVASAYRAVEEAKAALTEAKTSLELKQKLHATGAVSLEVVDAAKTKVVAAQQKIAAAEAELLYLQGRGPAAKKTGGGTTLWRVIPRDPNTVRPTQTIVLDRGPNGTRLRKVLDKPVKLKFNNTPLTEVIQALRKEAGGIHLQVSVPLDETKLTANLEDVPFGAALQLLEDNLTDARVVVRDYGFAVVRQNAVPPGAPLLNDFWKSKVAAPDRPTPGQRTTTSAKDHLEGKISRVDGKLATIDIGSDRGVQQGVLMEVFRLTAEPKYLGRIRITQVTPTQSVGEIVGRAVDTLKIGDSVSSWLAGPAK